MASPSKKRDTRPLGDLVVGFIENMRFDKDLKRIGISVEQITIFPDPPKDWESECCRLISGVCYEYTRVSKTNPLTTQSDTVRTNNARKAIRRFIRVAKTERSVLRIIKDSAVIKLDRDGSKYFIFDVIYLEESYNSLSADDIALERTTREIPRHLQEFFKGASKNSGAKSNKRRPK